jgi:hypothetical protein
MLLCYVIVLLNDIPQCGAHLAQDAVVAAHGLGHQLRVLACQLRSPAAQPTQAPWTT